MISSTTRSSATLIRAAGGVVWRDARRARLAVINRGRYRDDEHTLPKGKLEPAEGWREAAVREVREEICCDARIVGFVDAVDYDVNGIPKVVLFFEMEVETEYDFEPSEEVLRLEWLTPEQASEKLSHVGEQQVASQFSTQA